MNGEKNRFAILCSYCSLTRNAAQTLMVAYVLPKNEKTASLV